jgi:hypothetical protein
MSKRLAVLAAGFASVSLALAGCGDSVAAGGENASTHPASGIWVSPTVGGLTVSELSPTPTVPYQAPSSTPPRPLPPGLVATVQATQAAVTGGCWQDAHFGNVYGAYDQLFWWQGQCGDTIGQVTVELYASVAAATANDHHPTSNALLERYQDGAVIVDVYANGPLSVLSELAGVKGMGPAPGYGA